MWRTAALLFAAAAVSVRMMQPAPGPKVQLLHQLEGAHNASPAGLRLTVGWNTNVDLLVDLPAVAARLGLSPASSAARDPQKILSRAELEAAVSYWFSRGGAAERLVGGPDAAALFDAVVATSAGVEGSRYRVGGNAALMATSLARLGCQVHLGGPIGETLAGLLDARIRTTSPAEMTADAVHLILDDGKGQTMGDMTAPRANRFILVHDPLNARLAGLEPLNSAVSAAAPPHAFVASGLNQLEALSVEERGARLQDVRSALSELPPALPIHLELASMADAVFVKKMASTLFPLADSFGLNEQELAYLFESVGGRYSDFDFGPEALTGKVPTLRAVTSTIAFVLQRADEWSRAASGGAAGAATDEAENDTQTAAIRRISRVHFHCLSYHVIAERAVPGRERWTKELWRATAQGSAAATNNACGPSAAPTSALTWLKRLLVPEYFQESDLELLYDKPCTGEGRNGVCYWTEAGGAGDMPIMFSLAPVLVCATPRNTVGLGDAISSTGLAYSLV